MGRCGTGMSSVVLCVASWLGCWQSDLENSGKGVGGGYFFMYEREKLVKGNKDNKIEKVH